jgi:hypothetical protein
VRTRALFGGLVPDVLLIEDKGVARAKACCADADISVAQVVRNLNANSPRAASTEYFLNNPPFVHFL